MVDDHCSFAREVPPTDVAAPARTPLVAILVALSLALAGPASADPYPDGTLILPSDQSTQDLGVFTVYGLVQKLLRAGVPVTWNILPGKSKGDTDFSATASLWDGSSVASRDYRGGPWTVHGDLVDQDVMDLVADWLLEFPNTNVHVATVGFDAPIERTMYAAPPIAVTVDGHEDIAFDYLNAAGILDSIDQEWPAERLGDCSAYPDIHTPAELVGDPAIDNDGALFDSDGNPLYAELDVMHYDPSSLPVGLAAELRAFLEAGYNHLFLECHSIEEFEAASDGFFLTTGGIQDGHDPGSNLAYSNQHLAITQHDGDVDSTNGSIQSIRLDSSSAYKPGALTLIKKSGEADGVKDLLVFGQLDNDPDCGWVTFMGGHSWDVDTPASANDESNGVRFYLNGLYVSDLLREENIPQWSLTKTGPATTAVAEVTWTIDWATSGLGVAFDSSLVDTLPDDVTFVAASGGGIYDGASHKRRLPGGADLPEHAPVVGVGGVGGRLRRRRQPRRRGLRRRRPQHLPRRAGTLRRARQRLRRRRAQRRDRRRRGGGAPGRRHHPRHGRRGLPRLLGWWGRGSPLLAAPRPRPLPAAAAELTRPSPCPRAPAERPSNSFSPPHPRPAFSGRRRARLETHPPSGPCRSIPSCGAIQSTRVRRLISHAAPI